MQSLPQLETNTFSGQIFWLFISFLILYFFISKAFLPKIFDIVSQRENYFNNIKENIINLKEKILKIKNSNKDILEKSKLQVNSILKDSKEQKDELKKNFDLQKDLVLKENNAQFMIDIKNNYVIYILDLDASEAWIRN
jgi:F-type H+-transporting ATPase subunit b